MKKYLRMCPIGREESCNDKGFTLIEALLAMAVLGVGLLSIATLQVNNTSLNSSSRLQTEGYTWAMDQVENLLHGVYDTDADLQVQGSAAVVGDGHIVAQGPYTVEWDVVDNSANIANTRFVSVSIRHNNREVAQVNYTRVRESF